MFDQYISVIVPFKSDGGHRQRNWDWIKHRYELLMPNAEICMGDSDIEPYCKPAAINSAAGKATRDIFIIADADMVFDIWQMEAAIELLSKSPWVIPFIDTNLLTESQTNDLLQKDPSVTLGEIDFTGCDNYLCSAGQINMVTREGFKLAGGFDERFKGWGWEDVAFQRAMDAVCGNHRRPEGVTMWHLYHHQAPTPLYQVNYDILNKFYGDKNTIRAERGLPMVEETW